MPKTSATDKTAAEIRREYFRKWRAENKEKVAHYNREYWRRKAEEIEREQEAAKNGNDQ